jgi:hypothetical protein
MEDAIQVAFLCIVSILGGGLGVIGVVAVSLLAARRQ